MRRFAVPGPLDHAMLATRIQKSRAKKWLRFSQGVCGPSPTFDGDSVETEPMDVPHRSRMDSTGMALDEI